MFLGEEINIFGNWFKLYFIENEGMAFGMAFGGNHTIEDTKLDIKSTTAYQAMLGVTIDPVVIPFKFDIEGRALYAPDIYENPENGTKPDMLQYGIRAKARFIF